ncbi:MAG: SPFH/Band 7/PHB domain protein, partial [candidate division Zixibacteria bacterium]|nr:SPFH/Band 7/PHB domain protein [candidate division Zixibacteria bacterium]
DDKLITLRYLESLKQIADGKANKLFFPIEATSLLSSVGLVADMLKPGPDKTKPVAEAS